jgi:hypothetical protein
MAALMAACEGLTWPQRFTALGIGFGVGFVGAILWNASKALVRRVRA